MDNGNVRLFLNDLLHWSEEDCRKAKVKFNQYNNKDNPLDIYLSAPDQVNTDWLFWRTKRRYFFAGQIAVCLVRLSYDTWLLTTIKEVVKELGVLHGVNYEGLEIEKFRPLYGRVVIKYHKTSQQQGRAYESIKDELEVLQLLPSVYDGEDFPGYDKVRLSFAQLANIVSRRKKDWISALENQKAVYLITDRHSGKLYVGSATAEKGMLLQRWSAYVATGHGENVELKKLVEREGFDYVKKNFQYSILENYNAKIDDQVVLARESWWKETLDSRVHGYNEN